MPNVEKEKDKIIDLPSDGPDVEVTLPEETVKEGAQEVAVPEVKPEGEVEVKEEAPKKETETKELIQEAPKEEAPKEEAPKEKELESMGKALKKESPNLLNVCVNLNVKEMKQHVMLVQFLESKKL